VVERLLGRRDRGIHYVTTLVTDLADRNDDAAMAATERSLEILAAWVQSDEIPAGELDMLHNLLNAVVRRLWTGPQDHPVSQAAALLSTSWKDATAFATTRRVFERPGYTGDRRLQALRALVAAQAPGIPERALRVAADPGAGPVEFRGQVLATLGRIDDPVVAGAVLEHYPALDAALKPRAIDLLTQRTPWSLPLLDAIDAGKVPADVLDLNQVRKLQASKHAGLAARVKARYGTVREGRNPAREQVIAAMRKLLSTRPGDPHAGLLVFKKLCAQCHKIHGAGEDVGPDLTQNGRASFEQLLSNVFDPSLVIGSAYQATTVATTDGRVLSGLIAEESPLRVVLKTQGGKQEVIAREEVEAMKIGPVSLMPEELEKQLSEQELRDLFSFLTLDRPPTDPAARPIPGTRD
jgi:putative heme-binding domain-containing protein